MAEESPDNTANNPEESKAGITSVPNNPPDNIIEGEKSKSESTEDSNTESNNPQPLPVKMEESKGWKRAEIISLVSIIFTASLFYMNIKSFEKTTQAVAISDSTYRHNRIKDSIAEVKEMQKEYFDSIKTRKADSIREAERKDTYRKDSTTFNLSKRAFEAQVKSFTENQKAAAFSKQVSMSEIRPYISIKIPNNLDLKIDSLVKISAIVINNGKSTAFKCRTMCAIVFSENERGAEVIINGVENNIGNGTISDIGATQQMAYDVATEINNNRPKILKEIFKVYVAVNCIYFDTFGIKHFSHLFVYYDIRDKSFLLCSKYNDSN